MRRSTQNHILKWCIALAFGATFVQVGGSTAREVWYGGRRMKAGRLRSFLENDLKLRVVNVRRGYKYGSIVTFSTAEDAQLAVQMGNIAAGGEGSQDCWNTSPGSSVSVSAAPSFMTDLVLRGVRCASVVLEKPNDMILHILARTHDRIRTSPAPSSSHEAVARRASREDSHT